MRKLVMPERNTKENLKKKILEEMTVDYARVLEQNFDLAKQLVRLTKDGEVEILVREKVSGQEKILLYLIGRLYAKEAGLTSTDEVGNKELMEKLGIPLGSLLPWLKSLRDENKIKQIERDRYTYHSIPINLVDRTLREIMEKVKRAG
jgi:hypothetical protein